MIIGSLPFAHYLAMMRGGWRSLLNDPQVRWFLILITSLVLLLCWNLTQNGQTLGNALRQATFNVNHDRYWLCQRQLFNLGRICTTILLLVMFIGGCGGSTTCGIKVFRLQVLAATVKVQINRLLKPHAVVLAYYNRRPVSTEVMDLAMGFFTFTFLALC